MEISFKLARVFQNKLIILASITLCVAVIFFFSLEEYGLISVAAESAPLAAEEYVIESDENIIQPAPNSETATLTQTEAIIYDNSMSGRVSCGLSQITDTDPAFNYNFSARKLYLPILMYHYIEEPGTTTLPWLYHSPAIFEAQLKTLAANCYNAIFVSEAAKAIAGTAILPSKPIAITFDDGYADMYTTAYPLLKKYNLKGTMYVIVNALDKPGYLTKEQAKEMAASGFVEIASHTLNHANLNQSGWEKAHYEIATSKTELEKIIGKDVDDFAYPYGFFTGRDEAICRQAGYLSCASTYPGQVQTYSDRFSLYRLRPGYRVGAALVNWLEQVGPKK